MQHVPIQTPTSPQPTAPTPGLRQDIFTLQGGGYVTASLPEALSKQEYEDLKDWLELMQRKAERKIVEAPAATVRSVPPMPESGDDEEHDPDYR